jgi:hypothetical protein
VTPMVTEMSPSLMRPVFYLGFVGLSAYFLFSPRIIEESDEISEMAVPELPR